MARGNYTRPMNRPCRVFVLMQIVMLKLYGVLSYLLTMSGVQSTIYT